MVASRMLSVCCLLGLGLLLALGLGTCSEADDGSPPQDQTVVVDSAHDRGIQPDVRGADEPFGRLCTKIGADCPDQDQRGFKLTCVGVNGGAPGKGFCTTVCSSIGSSCFGVPNGQWAECILKSPGTDAAPGTEYCGFLCRVGKRSWVCPGTLTCGKPDSQGTALCVP